MLCVEQLESYWQGEDRQGLHLAATSISKGPVKVNTTNYILYNFKSSAVLLLQAKFKANLKCLNFSF